MDILERLNPIFEEVFCIKSDKAHRERSSCYILFKGFDRMVYEQPGGLKEKLDEHVVLGSGPFKKG